MKLSLWKADSSVNKKKQKTLFYSAANWSLSLSALSFDRDAEETGGGVWASPWWWWRPLRRRGGWGNGRGGGRRDDRRRRGWLWRWRNQRHGEEPKQTVTLSLQGLSGFSPSHIKAMYRLQLSNQNYSLSRVCTQSLTQVEQRMVWNNFN